MYPKTFTHRQDRNATVVVMNAEQEAELPAEFRPLPAAAGQSQPTTPTMTPAEALLLSPEYADFIADRDQLSVDRANLTAGYKADKALLDADRELLDAQRAQLDEERAQFEQYKAATRLDVPTAPAKEPAADAEKDGATEPVKRARVAKD